MSASPAPPAWPDPLMVELPERLHTARLLLRPFQRGDGAALFEALRESAADLRRHLGHLTWVAQDHTPETAEARCRRCEANFVARTDLPYLMFDAASGTLLGSVGLHRTDWALPKTEVGYWVRSSAAGRGVASEGVRALTDWALGPFGARRVELVTDRENLASRRVAERCGFVLEGVHRHVTRAPDGTLRDHCVYARHPPAA